MEMDINFVKCVSVPQEFLRLVISFNREDKKDLCDVIGRRRYAIYKGWY